MSILISLNWPKPLPQEGDEDFDSFSMSVRRPREFVPPPAPRRVGSEYAVLPLIARFLSAFVREAITAGYAVRADAPRNYAWDGPWPKWCRTPAVFDAIVDNLCASIGTEQHADIYPFSFWFVPASDAKAESLVDLFRRLPEDGDVMTQAQARGAMWSSLDEQWFDVNADWRYAERPVEWARRAMQDAGTDVRWEPWFPDG